MPTPPADDADVPRWWTELGVPGLVDVHVHVLPDRVQQKVRGWFDQAETHDGAPWPITYRGTVAERLDALELLGTRPGWRPGRTTGPWSSLPRTWPSATRVSTWTPPCSRPTAPSG